MQGSTSAAALKRRLAGVEPQPSPAHQAAGRKGGKARHGRKAGANKGRVSVVKRLGNEITTFQANVAQQQQFVRLQSVGIAVENSPAIVARLAKIAMGREPRARVADEITAGRTVLEIARIVGQDAAEHSRKADEPLNEIELGTLRALVGALESIRNQQPVIDAETVEPVDNSAQGEEYAGMPVDNSETAFNSTDCEPQQPDSLTVGPGASRPDAGELDAGDAGAGEAPRA